MRTPPPRTHLSLSLLPHLLRCTNPFSRMLCPTLGASSLPRAAPGTSLSPGMPLTVGAAPGPGSPGRGSLQVSLEPGPCPAALPLQRVQRVADGAHQPSHAALALRQQLRAGHTGGDTEIAVKWLNPFHIPAPWPLCPAMPGCKSTDPIKHLCCFISDLCCFISDLCWFLAGVRVQISTYCHQGGEIPKPGCSGAAIPWDKEHLWARTG